MRRAAARGYGVYLLGARPEIVTEAARRLRARTPPVRVVGWWDGYFTGREGEVVADITRAKQLLNWEPEIQLEEGLKRMLPSFGREPVIA